MLREKLTQFFSNFDGKILVFDIETIPDEPNINKFYTDEELAEKENMYQVSNCYHQPICFSYAEIQFTNGNFKITDNDVLYDEDESKLLDSIYHKMNEYSKFVSFNALTYDIPVLRHRCLIHGLKDTSKKSLANLYNLLDELARYPSKHFDMYVNLFKYQKGGLKALASFIGESKYGDYIGKDVVDLYKQSKIDELIKYAKEDSLITAKVFIRVVDFFRTNSK
jgi:predicted PolB exonuclease-like 3'-5' exonuclease